MIRKYLSNKPTVQSMELYDTVSCRNSTEHACGEVGVSLGSEVVMGREFWFGTGFSSVSPIS